MPEAFFFPDGLEASTARRARRVARSRARAASDVGDRGAWAVDRSMLNEAWLEVDVPSELSAPELESNSLKVEPSLEPSWEPLSRWSW